MIFFEYVQDTQDTVFAFPVASFLSRMIERYDLHKSHTPRPFGAFSTRKERAGGVEALTRRRKQWRL